MFGLDESAGFGACGIYDVQLLKQRLGQDAQSFVPPVRLSIADATVEPQPVVIAEIAECDAAFKPCTGSASHWATRRYSRSPGSSATSIPALAVRGCLDADRFGHDFVADNRSKALRCPYVNAGAEDVF